MIERASRQPPSSSRVAKRRVYEQFARVSKALAAPARLELVDLLLQGERSVEALASATELSVANAWRAAGLALERSAP